MNRDTQRYNLIFAGELLPGTRREEAQRVLADFFGLKDPGAVAVFFSGKPVPLRRQLKREDALRLYRQLRAVGLICDLQAVASAAPPPPPPHRSTGPEPPAGTGEAEAVTQSAAPPRSRVAGPNLFALRPAPGPPRGRNPGETAQLRFFVTAFIAVALCLLVITLTLRFPAEDLGHAPAGPLDAATLPDNALVLLLADALLVHERSGLARRAITARDLGLTHLAPPLWIGSDGTLLVNGGAALQAGTQLQRCNLEQQLCTPFLQDGRAAEVVAITASYLGDTIFLLTAQGELLRSDATGRVIAQATVVRPWGRDRIIAADGLLLLPAPDSPLLGVYRPDAAQFGAQLDALLLLVPGATEAGRDRIVDLAVGATARHALLGGEDATTALYRFDSRWGSAQSLVLPGDFNAAFLVPWRDRILVGNRSDSRMLRYGPDGHGEADFHSTLLSDARNRWEQQRLQQQLLRQLGIALPLFLAVICAVVALLYGAESRALQLLPPQRTALLDPMPAGINWVAPDKHSRRGLTRLGLLLFCATLLAALATLGSGATLSTLAWLPALLASAVAWQLLHRGAGGHLGHLEGRFILVDYDGRYFYGETHLLCGSPRCLLAPGVVLPLSLGPLVNINARGLTAPGAPLAPAKPLGPMEILGVLWHLDHPWLRAALALLGGWLVSLFALLLLQL